MREKIIFFVFIVVFLVYYIFDCSKQNRYASELRDSKLVDTTVATIINRTRGKNPNLRLAYSVNGKAIESISDYYHTEEVAAGDKVTIKYLTSIPSVCERLCEFSLPANLISVDTLISFDPIAKTESLYVGYHYMGDSVVTKIDTIWRNEFSFVKHYGIDGKAIIEYNFCKCIKVK
jgi:hypothetical protein